VLCVSPGKENPSFRVFGSSPLDQVVSDNDASVLACLVRDIAHAKPNRMLFLRKQ